MPWATLSNTQLIEASPAGWAASATIATRENLSSKMVWVFLEDLSSDSNGLTDHVSLHSELYAGVDLLD